MDDQCLLPVAVKPATVCLALLILLDVFCRVRDPVLLEPLPRPVHGQWVSSQCGLEVGIGQDADRWRALCVRFTSAADFGDEDAVVTAVCFTLRGIEGVLAAGLHPLGDGDPTFVVVNPGHTKVTQSRPAFGNQDAFRAADDLESLGVKACHEQRCPVAEHMIIVRPTACVDEIQPIAQG